MSEGKKLPVKLELDGEYSDNTMCFRMSGATAELADGRKVEVSSTMGMTGIVVIVSNPDKTWRTYFLSSQALAQAVLQHEDRLNAKMVEDSAPNPALPSSSA